MEWWERTNNPAKEGFIFEEDIVDDAGVPQHRANIWSEVSYFKPAAGFNQGTTGQGPDFDEFMKKSMRFCQEGEANDRHNKYVIGDTPQDSRFGFAKAWTEIRWRLVGAAGPSLRR